MTSVLGSKIVWWIDPMGATVLAILIIGLWGHTAYRRSSTILLLTSRWTSIVNRDFSRSEIFTASDVYYVNSRHADTPNRYMSSVSFWTCNIARMRGWLQGVIIEVDIVMHPLSTLRETHDVSQALQDKLELLPGVERCYIHCDFETEHKPEHRKKTLWHRDFVWEGGSVYSGIVFNCVALYICYVRQVSLLGLFSVRRGFLRLSFRICRKHFIHSEFNGFQLSYSTEISPSHNHDSRLYNLRNPP